MKIILIAILLTAPLSAFATSKDDTRDANGYPKDYRQPLTQERVILGR